MARLVQGMPCSIVEKGSGVARIEPQGSQHLRNFQWNGVRQVGIKIRLPEAARGGDLFHERHGRPRLVLAGGGPADVPERDHVLMDQGQIGIISDLAASAAASALLIAISAMCSRQPNISSGTGWKKFQVPDCSH